MTNVDVHSSADAMDASADADALTIGRRIRQLRTARGMTLDELAAAVERAPSQLSMIETGKREPKLTLLRAIARALGATVDQLLEAETLDERATLEIALERAMKGQTFRALGIACGAPAGGQAAGKTLAGDSPLRRRVLRLVRSGRQAACQSRAASTSGLGASRTALSLWLL